MLTTFFSIVAVAGLEDDAFRSWVSPDQDQMWLRDFLPYDLEDQRPRILTFGYDPSHASISAFSSLLLESVTSARIEQQVRINKLRLRRFINWS
jgi:hypothetical protein